MSSDVRPVGLTADAGFQIGVSATVDRPVDEVWAFLVSREGAALWLGPGAELGTTKGAPYETADGSSGEVRSFHPGDRIRLTYQPAGRNASTILQVVVRPAATAGRTSVRFHQERLEDPLERSAQRDHWRRVLEVISAGLRA